MIISKPFINLCCLVRPIAALYRFQRKIGCNSNLDRVVEPDQRDPSIKMARPQMLLGVHQQFERTGGPGGNSSASLRCKFLRVLCS